MDNLIFSDLDGTLLDAADYSFAGAKPALDMLRARGIPLVLCSSKTRAEIEEYRRKLNNEHPFIAENGGGVFIPRGYFTAPLDFLGLFDVETLDGYVLTRFGMPYAKIRCRFEGLRAKNGAKVRGFGDMTDEEIADLTGLSLEEAALAKRREFDEAFVFDGPADQSFLDAIEADGLHWTQGQYFHILGDHDKGRAVELLESLYRREYGALASVGLGDSFNDLPMLRAVDHPVLVRKADGSYDKRVDLPNLLKTQQPGPLGWNGAVLQLLAAPPHEAGMSRQPLAEIFSAALAAADPYRAVLNAVRLEDGNLVVTGVPYDLSVYERIIVAGAGKAAARMALAVEELLGERISVGLVIVKRWHKAPLRGIEQVESSHPVPGEAGAAATQRMLGMLRTADEKTLVLCLLSGGASALLVAPAEGVTLKDKQVATAMLLNAGASIAELNAVRKHLSAVKGGRLAEAAFPAQLVALILSDVIGDRLDVIASGPTAPDASSFADAWAVIAKYGLQEQLPPRVADCLRRGMAGLVPETVKLGAPCFDRTQNVIVAGIGQALTAAAEQARRLDYVTEILGAELQGEARDAARMIARRARAELAAMRAGERRCLLWGGETTVTVRGTGKGGRNQELALAFALEVEGESGIALLSAGTDGTDGPTDAAGAMADGETAARARSAGLDPVAYLEDNDSYGFFHRLDELTGGHSHFITGPTGTNVMDIQIVLLDKGSD
jgi:hydroxypyruvate reductase